MKLLKKIYYRLRPRPLPTSGPVQKDLATESVGTYSLGMSLLPFPDYSAELEEYTSVMNAMADEAEASAPDTEPSGWSPDEESDELRAREDYDHCSSMYESEGSGEDSSGDF